MALTIGLSLSAMIALAIVFIGLGFFLEPYAAAAAYGVPVTPNPSWEAFLSVKAVYDIASGLFTSIVLIHGPPHLLGWFKLAATFIPITEADRLAPWRNQDPALGIHGGTALGMLNTAGPLTFG